MKISLRLEPLEIFLLGTNFMEIDEITEEKFLKLFKKIAKKEFNLEFDYNSLVINFTNSKRRLGTVYIFIDPENKSNIKITKFEFSRINLFSKELSIDTIRHELCHCKVMIDFGRFDDNGKKIKHHGKEFIEMTKKYKCNFLKKEEEISFMETIFHPIKGSLFYKNWLFLQEEKALKDIKN